MKAGLYVLFRRAFHGVQNGRRGVDVHHIAEFIRLGRAAGLNASGQVARVVTAGAAVAGGAEQIAQRAVAEKIQRLVGDLELHLARFTVAATALGAARLLGVEIRRSRDVAGLLHALDDLLDQLLQLIAHLLLAAFGLVAEHFLERVFRQHAAVEQCLENGIVQRLHGLVAVVAGVARVAKPARHQQVRQLRHEFIHVQVVQRVGGVFRVFVFHVLQRRLKPPLSERSEGDGTEHRRAMALAVA